VHGTACHIHQFWTPEGAKPARSSELPIEEDRNVDGGHVDPNQVLLSSVTELSFAGMKRTHEIGCAGTEGKGGHLVEVIVNRRLAQVGDLCYHDTHALPEAQATIDKVCPTQTIPPHQ
jgi:hypothetical protein